MGFFDKLINKVTDSAAKGVGNAVQKTAERKVTEAVQGQVDKAADKLIKTGKENVSDGQNGADNNIPDIGAGVNTAGMSAAANTSAAGIAGLAGIMSGFAVNAANEAAKNIKVCSKCNQPAGADKKFCPACGAALPEKTLAAGAVCQKCGKQNSIGERFCSDCGTKLTIAEQAEQSAKARDDEVMKQWNTNLPQFPKWTGGHGFSLENDGPDSDGRPYYRFSAQGVNPSHLAQYRLVLKQNGFRPAGEYPSEDMLYKRLGGTVYCFESAEPFCSDAGVLTVSFGAGEPSGGFDYVKTEKKEKKGFFRF